MSNIVFGLLAETFIHNMGKYNMGLVDLPMAREASTDYPYIPSATLKRGLDSLLANNQTKVRNLRSSGFILGQTRFSNSHKANHIKISDARLILLPARSLNSAYKWVTCPHLLERLFRDMRRCGHADLPNIISLYENLDERCYLGYGEFDKRIYMEDRSFEYQGPIPGTIYDLIARLISEPSAKKRLERQLVIVQDDEFNWFAKFGLQVQIRNIINNDATEDILFEETLPPDTLMYTVLEDDSYRTAEVIKNALAIKPYLRSDHVPTMDTGWFSVQIV